MFLEWMRRLFQVLSHQIALDPIRSCNHPPEYYWLQVWGACRSPADGHEMSAVVHEAGQTPNLAVVLPLLDCTPYLPYSKQIDYQFQAYELIIRVTATKSVTLALFTDNRDRCDQRVGFLRVRSLKLRNRHQKCPIIPELRPHYVKILDRRRVANHPPMSLFALEIKGNTTDCIFLERWQLVFGQEF